MSPRTKADPAQVTSIPSSERKQQINMESEVDDNMYSVTTAYKKDSYL